MATSFQSKLNDLEARLKAENESSGRARRDFTLPTGSPRRPKAFNFSDLNKLNNRTGPSPPNSAKSTVTTAPPFSIADGMSNRGDRYGGGRPGFLTGPAMMSSERADCMTRVATAPVSLALGPAYANTGSTTIPTIHPSLSIPSMPVVPRRRGQFQLPCSPHSPQPQKTPDSAEIEQKYQEIMKMNGVLSLEGQPQRTASDISDLESLGELGHGTCGQVFKMRHRRTGHQMAVKQMRRSGNRDENKRIIMDLDVVLKSHDCPYIVECYGTFITQSDVWICMELMSTCLDKLLKKLKAPLPERILGKVAVATVKALNYLKEEHGVIHRDIKPSNILVDDQGFIKLCDFGISGRLVDSKAKTRSAGCAAYMAPERIDPPDPTRPDYDIRADVWSLGISLVELATGEFPYTNCKSDFEVLSKVLQEDPPVLPPGQGFSMDFCSFVRDCLAKDYRKRPKYRKLLEHPFIKRYEIVNINVAAWYRDIMFQVEMSRTNSFNPFT